MFAHFRGKVCRKGCENLNDFAHLFYAVPPPTVPLPPSFKQCFGSGSAWIRFDFGQLDPDPHWEYGSVPRRPKKTQKNIKRRNFMFYSAGCSLLRAEGFTCRLDVLYRGLWISKLEFVKKKDINKIFSCLFSS